MSEDVIVYDARVAPVVGPPGEKNVGYAPDLETLAWIAVEEYYPYGKPEIIDQRGIDSSSLSVLYGSGGPGTKLLPGDFDIVRNFYKFEMDFSKGYDAVGDGDFFWGIFQIEIKEGPSILQPQVYDLAGVKLTYQNIIVFMTWPDCPDTFPPGVMPQYGPGVGVGFTGQGIFGQTEGHGDVGFGTSGGSHIGPDGGAFTVWLSSDNDPAGPRQGSDAIHKIGWFDNHIHPNPRFKVMQKGSVTPPPSTGNRLVVYLNGEPVMYFISTEPGDQGNGMFLEDAEGNKSLFFPGLQV